MGNITAAQVAKRLGVSRAYVYKLLKQRRIPGAYRDGEFWVIPEEGIYNVEPRKMGRPRKR